MVIRSDARGTLAVGQPAHAWLCGQFARGWGNARFGAVTPLDDVALGAEQHDLGWSEWDLAPALDPATGLPQNFTAVAPSVSTELWRSGPVRLESQSRYAALLATMHGRRLYDRIDLDARTPAEAAAITRLLAESAERERRLRDALSGDPALTADGAAEQIARNSNLLWTWDTLSLALLLDWAPLTLSAVPTAAQGAVDVDVRAVPPRDGLPALSLSPWPFADPDAIVVTTEGRRLEATYATQAALDDALARAPWERIGFMLVAAAAAGPAER